MVALFSCIYAQIYLSIDFRFTEPADKVRPLYLYDIVDGNGYHKNYTRQARWKCWY